MQTQPAKNRTAVTVGAGLVLAVMVGALAIWGLNRKAEPAPENTNLSMTEQLNGSNSVDLGGNNPVAPAGGETANPSSTQPVAAPLTDKQVPETHTVQAGESLSDISRTYYGSHIYAGDIEEANQLPDPNKIMAGQVLTLPRPEELSAPSSASPESGTDTDTTTDTETTTDTDTETVPSTNGN